MRREKTGERKEDDIRQVKGERRNGKLEDLTGRFGDVREAGRRNT